MTLGQVGLLIRAERQFHEPASKTNGQAQPGTVADLAMFAAMKVG